MKPAKTTLRKSTAPTPRSVSPTPKCPFAQSKPSVLTNRPAEARSHFDTHQEGLPFPNNFLAKTKLFLCRQSSCNTNKQCFHTTPSCTTRDNNSTQEQRQTLTSFLTILSWMSQAQSNGACPHLCCPSGHHASMNPLLTRPTTVPT